MSARRYLIPLLLVVCAVIPVVIGASCPPASIPTILSIVQDNNALTQAAVPGCIAGFVCINLANGSAIPVQIALYVHNGFDPNNLFPDPPTFACCSNPNATSSCPCPCAGADIGECLLNRIEIFDIRNQRAVNGLQVLALAPNQSVLTRIRCGDIKTVGAAVAQIPGDPILAADDRNGPIYRDEPGGVNCGQTVQFLAVDLNQTGAGTGTPGQGLAVVVLRAQFSR